MPQDRNTSQDPEYVGPVGHEKKFHKTHFHMPRSLKQTGPRAGWAWVYVGVGRYKLVRQETEDSRRAT